MIKPVSKALPFDGPTGFYVGILAAILLTATIGGALYLLLSHSNADANANLVKETALDQANKLDAKISQFTVALQKTATRPDVIAALTSTTENDSALELLSQKIREENDDFSQASLIPWGKPENFPLSFAELDQVKRTEKGETTYPEAILFNGNWIFYVTVPVWNASREQIIGTLFATGNIDRIKADFADNPVFGSLSLVQSFYNIAPRILFTVGDITPQLRAENMAPVGQSHWQVLFTPSPEFYKDHGINLIMLMGVLIALGLVLAVVVILLLRAARNAHAKDNRPIKGMSAARILARGGKVDASRVAGLVAEEQGESAPAKQDFNDISDPLFQHNDILDISDIEIADEEPPSLSLESVVHETPPPSPAPVAAAVNPVATAVPVTAPAPVPARAPAPVPVGPLGGQDQSIPSKALPRRCPPADPARRVPCAPRSLRR